MPTDLAQFVANAQLLALSRLVDLLQNAKSDREVRLAAAAILRFTPPKASAATAAVARPRPHPQPPPPDPAPLAAPPPPRSASAPAAEPPLTDAEIAELAAFLPAVPRRRFSRKHTPAYWRDVLAQQRRFHIAQPRAAPPAGLAA